MPHNPCTFSNGFCTLMHTYAYVYNRVVCILFGKYTENCTLCTSIQQTVKIFTKEDKSCGCSCSYGLHSTQFISFNMTKYKPTRWLEACAKKSVHEVTQQKVNRNISIVFITLDNVLAGRFCDNVFARSSFTFFMHKWFRDRCANKPNIFNGLSVTLMCRLKNPQSQSIGSVCVYECIFAAWMLTII